MKEYSYLSFKITSRLDNFRRLCFYFIDLLLSIIHNVIIKNKADGTKDKFLKIVKFNIEENHAIVHC